MATIRPSSDLRNKYNEISEFCNKYNEDEGLASMKKGTGRSAEEVFAEIERAFGFDRV